MLSLASRLPAELIRLVVDHLVHATVSGLGPGSHHTALWAYKDDLSACSLTCKYWYKIFQPYIFWEITLRTKQDTLELLSLVGAPGSNLRHHIQQLRIYQEDRQIAWLHLVFSSRNKLPNCRAVVLDLDNPLRLTSAQSLTSIHYILPRTLPSMFSDVHSFSLSSHTFRSFAELTRLVRSMPNLTTLACDKVAWSNPAEASLRPLRFAPRLQHISAIECQETGPLLHLFATTKHAHTVYPSLESAELAAIQDIVHLLSHFPRNSSPPAGLMRFQTNLWLEMVDTERAFTFHHIQIFNSPRKIVRLIFENNLSAPAVTLTASLSTAQASSHVSAVNLHFTLTATISDDIPPSHLADELINPPWKADTFAVQATAPEEITSLGWEEIDRVVSGLPQLLHCTVHISCSERLSQVEFTALVDVIRGRMPATNASMLRALNITGGGFSAKVEGVPVE